MNIFVRNSDETLIDITTLNIPINTIEISIQSCRLQNIPKNFFMKFVNLENINLQNNSISECFDIPRNVTYLNLAFNRFTNFDFDAVNNQRLEYLDLRNNFIPEIPVIKNRQADLIIKYSGNNKNYDKFNELDPFNKFVKKETKEARAVKVVKEEIIKELNVHNTKHQSNTQNSIEYLISTLDPKNPKILKMPDPSIYKYDSNYINGIIKLYEENEKNDLIYNYKTLLEFYNNIDSSFVYNYTDNKTCNMSEILERVWVISKTKNKEERKSIMANLFIQMEDGKDFCLVGKFTRIVSTLVSFEEEIKLEISFALRFSNFMDTIKANNTFSKEKLLTFVNESDITVSEKKTWLENIDMID